MCFAVAICVALAVIVVAVVTSCGLARAGLRWLGKLLIGKVPNQTSKTLCPSGLRGWTQVPLARAAWVRIPQVSYADRLAR